MNRNFHIVSKLDDVSGMLGMYPGVYSDNYVVSAGPTCRPSFRNPSRQRQHGKNMKRGCPGNNKTIRSVVSDNNAIFAEKSNFVDIEFSLSNIAVDPIEYLAEKSKYSPMISLEDGEQDQFNTFVAICPNFSFELPCEEKPQDITSKKSRKGRTVSARRNEVVVQTPLVLGLPAPCRLPEQTVDTEKTERRLTLMPGDLDKLFSRLDHSNRGRGRGRGGQQAQLRQSSELPVQSHRLIPAKSSTHSPPRTPHPEPPLSEWSGDWEQSTPWREACGAYDGTAEESFRWKELVRLTKIAPQAFPHILRAAFLSATRLMETVQSDLHCPREERERCCASFGVVSAPNLQKVVTRLKRLFRARKELVGVLRLLRKYNALFSTTTTPTSILLSDKDDSDPLDTISAIARNDSGSQSVDDCADEIVSRRAAFIVDVRAEALLADMLDTVGLTEMGDMSSDTMRALIRRRAAKFLRMLPWQLNAFVFRGETVLTMAATETLDD